MTEPFGRLRKFFRELKRRSVYRLAATYAVVGFVLIQAAGSIRIQSRSVYRIGITSIHGVGLSWAFPVN